MISAVILGDSPARKYIWQVEKLKNKPVLLYSAEALHNSTVDEILLVVGKDYHQVLNKIRFKSPKLRIVMNRRYDRGFSSYLRAGMGMLSPECEAVFVVPGEYPLVYPSLYDKMIAFLNSEKSGIMAPVYKNQVGYPYLFRKRYFNQIKRLTGNDIGSSIMERFAKDVFNVEVDTPGVLLSYDRIKDMNHVEIEKMLKEGISQQEIAEISETINVAKIEHKIKPVKLTDSREIQRKQLDKMRKTNEIKKEKDSKVSPDLSLKMLNDLLGKKEKNPDTGKMQSNKNKDNKPGKGT